MVAVCKLQSCTGTLPTACTTCATDYWHNQDAQSANLGTCSMCTACTAGTYESVDCLVVADRTCPSCTAVVDIATDADTAAEDGLDATTTCVSASSSRVSACRLGFFKTVGVDAVANAATCTGADDGAGTGTACALNTDSSACAVAGADCAYTAANAAPAGYIIEMTSPYVHKHAHIGISISSTVSGSLMLVVSGHPSLTLALALP